MWLTTAPFGRPVVPPVKVMATGAAGSTVRSGGRPDPAASASSKSGPPATITVGTALRTSAPIQSWTAASTNSTRGRVRSTISAISAAA